MAKLESNDSLPYSFEDELGKTLLTNFTDNGWGPATRLYMRSCSTLKPSSWTKIIDGARIFLPRGNKFLDSLDNAGIHKEGQPIDERAMFEDVSDDDDDDEKEDEEEEEDDDENSGTGAGDGMEVSEGEDNCEFRSII